MGQYFNAVSLDAQEYIYSHDYGSGSKLMEHSWLLNPMVSMVVTLLSPVGKWHKHRLVWAGDYMDEGLFMQGIKGNEKQETKLYDCCGEDKRFCCILKIRPAFIDGIVPQLILNHDTKEFVSLTNLPECDPRDPGWKIHPLPLLTCSGNGRGGGDFFGENPYVGAWAGHCVSAEYSVPRGYKQIFPDFIEPQTDDASPLFED